MRGGSSSCFSSLGVDGFSSEAQEAVGQCAFYTSQTYLVFLVSHCIIKMQ